MIVEITNDITFTVPYDLKIMSTIACRVDR